MKKYSLLLASFMLMTVLSACTGNSSQPPATTTPETTENSGNTAPGGETTTPASTPTADEARIIANKQLVIGLYNDVLNGHQLDKVNQYIAENYTEHNPYRESGRDQFSTFYEGIFKHYPNYKSEITGMMGQGDLVAVFSSGNVEATSTKSVDATSAEASNSETTTDATSTTTSATGNSEAKTAIYVDIYRISNNQIAEHWDVQQSVDDPAKVFTPDKLPTLSAKTELASTDRATVAANANFVNNFFNTFFVQHKTDIANEAVSENVEQYGSGIQNGRSALVSHYLTDFRANTDSKATLVNTIAEGNLVLVHSHMQNNSNDRGQAVIQLFRVDNGQIAAMWTLSQPVPESSSKDTTMF
ncbi:nuclear transport factor 2 family protein [Paenibacillus wenxiniae]|uniref:Ester cyclase n=1 Tax=Paenibacillus wenxiniae TaxID=1636843 RepID=A0ABW4RKB7_9BACL